MLHYVLWLLGIWLVTGIILSIFIKEEEELKGFLGFVVGLGIVVGISLPILLTMGYYDRIPTKQINTSNLPLVAIGDTQGIEGQMFLTAGYINDELVYYCYYQLKDGGYKGLRLDADDTTIYEGDKITPRVAVWNTLRLPTKANRVMLWPFPSWEPSDTRYKVYIPRGSIQRNYKLDLQ